MWPHLVIYIKITRFIHSSKTDPLTNNIIIIIKTSSLTGVMRPEAEFQQDQRLLLLPFIGHTHTHAEDTQPWAASRWTAKLLASYTYTHFLLG